MHLFTAESSVFVAVLCAASAAKENWQAAEGNSVALKRGSLPLHRAMMTMRLPMVAVVPRATTTDFVVLGSAGEVLEMHDATCLIMKLLSNIK